MTDLMKLADRCEAANGPDRELDNAIWSAVGPGPGIVEEAPSYTDSIDAARTMIPEGFDTVDYNNHPGVSADICLTGAGGRAVGKAATSKLAFCAAALRARHSVASHANVG